MEGTGLHAGWMLLCVSVTTALPLLPLPLQVDLPVDKGVVLLDIGFTGTDPNHGEQVGARGGSSYSCRSSEQHPVVGAVQRMLCSRCVACLVRMSRSG